MSDLCFPDSLLCSIPNIYYYAANNPSEATIAKRRSYANTISCASFAPGVLTLVTPLPLLSCPAMLSVDLEMAQAQACTLVAAEDV